jgi:hypothetical protein
MKNVISMKWYAMLACFNVRKKRKRNGGQCSFVETMLICGKLTDGKTGMRDEHNVLTRSPTMTKQVCTH